MSGGVLSATSQIAAGNTGTGILTFSGGTATVGTYNAAATLAGTTTLSGTGDLTANVFNVVGTNSSNTGTGTINLDGGTLRVNSFTANTTGSAVGTVNFNGGTVVARQNTTAFTNTGATTTYKVKAGGAIFNTAGFNITVDKALVADGVSTGGGLTKNGAGALTLSSNSNTYIGDTMVTDGTLILADNARLTFDIGATGVNNQISGDGVGINTVTLDGDFDFNLTTAGIGLGDSWTIVDTTTLVETFGTTFSVVGFTDMGGNIWEKLNGVTTYQFNEATGILSVVPEPTTWARLAAGLTFVMVMRRRRA
jgi:autotransporter-associated beta strand protein